MDTMIPYKVVSQVVAAVLNGHKHAVKYLSPTQTLKATRRGKIDRRSRAVEVLLTFGTPNYREREFIKKCKLSGEVFPVKKIQWS